ncbi:MAG: 50S ribosomal protein L5 [Candidatus Theseobacter exili]|nr:50S ribosomal protein L5 [Candidatus Theseobacter exili]
MQKAEAPRLKKIYEEQLAPELNKKFNYKNVFQIPKVMKVIINMGISEGPKDFAAIEEAVEELGYIVGQKPVITRAKKSIAGFKLREGQPVGCRVTLRGTRMYEFLDRFINVALPRIRDFRGVSTKSFDGRGNYSLGVTEQAIFPEVNLDKVKRVQGMDITIVTNTKSDEESLELLKAFGFPFRS